MKKCFVYISMVLAIGACKGKDDNKEPCSGVFCPAINPTIRFRIVDRVTGADYFFSDPPLYSVSELKVMIDDTTMGYANADSIHKYITTFDPGPGEHSLRITLPGLSADTIQFDMKYTQPACCTIAGTYLSVSINDTLVGNNLSDTTVLVIRK